MKDQRKVDKIQKGETVYCAEHIFAFPCATKYPYTYREHAQSWFFLAADGCGLYQFLIVIFYSLKLRDISQ